MCWCWLRALYDNNVVKICNTLTTNWACFHCVCPKDSILQQKIPTLSEPLTWVDCVWWMCNYSVYNSTWSALVTVDRQDRGWSSCCFDCLADIFLHTETKHNTTAVMTHSLNRLHFVALWLKNVNILWYILPCSFSVDTFIQSNTVLGICSCLWASQHLSTLWNSLRSHKAVNRPWPEMQILVILHLFS